MGGPTRRLNPWAKTVKNDLRKAHRLEMISGYFVPGPIMLPTAELCFSCHGAEKQKGDRRLDSRTAALKGGENHTPAIKPGDSAGSPLVHLVAIPARKHAISLQWNKKLVIEPFRPGNGILRETMNGKGKPND